LVQAVIAAQTKQDHARLELQNLIQPLETVSSGIADLSFVNDRDLKAVAEQRRVIVAFGCTVTFGQTITKGDPRTGGGRRKIHVPSGAALPPENQQAGDPEEQEGESFDSHAAV